MKKSVLLIAGLLTTLASTQSFAAQACAAHYTAGIGHLFKGESVMLGNVEKIKLGQSSKDELYTVSVSKSGQVSLTETQTGKKVDLKRADVSPELQIHVTNGDLKPYPEEVPGTFVDGRRFIAIMCADESNF
ncbi:hypothetical protein [Bdellovibrio sp. BCCA]|uniref:hypothetical protein n=1 Tax=Bdellovibrio sp. BCCA TaxID=3136281 RepID=UPI0030F1DC10